MLRPFGFSPGPGRHLCYACEQVLSCRPAQHAKTSLAASAISYRAAKNFQEPRVRFVPFRQFATARTSFKKQIERRQATNPAAKQESRFQSIDQDKRSKQEDAASPRSPTEFATLDELVSAVDRVTKAFLAQPGIPSEQVTYDALRACAQADLRRVHDIEKYQTSSQGVTKFPLLDSESRKKGGRSPATAAQPTDQAGLGAQEAVDRISEAAYTIISHPNVVITPKLLKAYVKLQSHFSKPETLPEVLDLFAAKPKPQLSGTTVRYVDRNPNKPENAVEKETAECALAAAIEAKDLDAAIGIVESTYATTAFVRSKILKGVLIPGIFITLAPIAAGVLAQQFSLFQESMDQSLATKIALAGILAYVGFMASLGVVVVATANDQMKRVTWTPGTPLRDRWMREDERAALDKVACAFGYTEKLRWGEEVGPEWDAFREYALRKSMILDAVELMEDVN